MEEYTTPWYLRFPSKWIQGKRYTLDGKTEITTGWYEKHVIADENDVLHFPNDFSREELKHMLKGLEMINNKLSKNK